MKFPLIPIIAGVVVVFLTAVLAVVSRWNKITKVKQRTCVNAGHRLTLTLCKLNLLMLYFSFHSAASRLCLKQPVLSASERMREATNTTSVITYSYVVVFNCIIFISLGNNGLKSNSLPLSCLSKLQYSQQLVSVA